jgi:EAL domain-containing protein (putative c-di-GMP-specific phosphodiesterase class I)
MHDNEGSEEIVRAIIALAHNLGMHVIGEGIEDSDQAAKLLALGCEYGQGFLFAEPTDPASFERLTADWDARPVALIGAEAENGG